MKKLGLLGGTSWHSSMDYYRLLNEGVNRKLGGVSSADLILRSVDFARHHQYQLDGSWDNIAEAFIQDARAMESMGAKGIVICANTMHKVAGKIQNAIGIEVLHIADAIKQSAQQLSISSLGLLGTIFTMEQRFYRDALERRELNVLVPAPDAQQEVNRIIFEELVLGEIIPSSQNYYLAQIETLHLQGAQAVVLGCTEIGMLVQQEMTNVPVIDSLKSHVDYLVNWMLS